MSKRDSSIPFDRLMLCQNVCNETTHVELYVLIMHRPTCDLFLEVSRSLFTRAYRSRFAYSRYISQLRV